uniref:PPM-type phosphatase domain-containing protein n=1 Tax=Aureoumbra lagunensis TaxID=44058 RepID=A0A7S3K3I8_9STRA|mmetsp:Transcript_16684/g.21701  ORF Transcript_16684/g.21701 Transcript_16684/m.21701 type:complete len:471 (+) Transcript_16684:158-1570(+)
MALYIRDGAAIAPGRKGKNEDRLAKKSIRLRNGKKLQFFSVFDGHGGKEAAEKCVDELHVRVADLLNSSFSTILEKDEEEKILKSAVAKAFWDIDDDLGSQGITAGTTATTLLLLFNEDSNQPYKAMIAWIGDSIGLCYDVVQGTRFNMTTRHNPEQDSEMQKLQAIWKLRKKAQRSGRALLSTTSSQKKIFETLDGSCSGQTSAIGDRNLSCDDTTIMNDTKDQSGKMLSLSEEDEGTQINNDTAKRSSPHNSDLDDGSPWDPDFVPISDRPGLAEDILHREAKITQSMRNFMRAQSPDFQELERQDTDVGPRSCCPLTGKPIGPIVVRAAWSNRKGKHIAGASTTVSRSIGDWDASRAVIPEADFVSWNLPPTENTDHIQFYHRVLLASDGLWDVLPQKRIEFILATTLDPQDACDKLMDDAKKKSIKSGFRTYKDDTALIIVDIKANGALPKMAAAGASTPCTCNIS